MDTDQKPDNIEREQETQRGHRQAALLGGQAGREAEGQELAICVLKRENLAQSLRTSRWS